MRKSLKIVIPIVVLALLVFLGYKVITKINYKNDVAENIENIPKLSYQNVGNGESFSNKNLAEGKAKIFIYFNTECEYCQHEAQNIYGNIEKLKAIQILFVSNEKPETIKTFSKKFKLTNYDNIYFLSDDQDTFARTFDATSIPYLVIYDKDKQLIKRIKGQTKVATILKALDKEN